MDRAERLVVAARAASRSLDIVRHSDPMGNSIADSAIEHLITGDG
jgi:hypothetical protein